MIEAGKPFALLLPVSVLHTGFVRDALLQASRGGESSEAVQCLIPRKTWVRKKDGTQLGFKYLCWFCHKTGLERDLIFITDDEDDDNDG